MGTPRGRASLVLVAALLLLLGHPSLGAHTKNGTNAPSTSSTSTRKTAAPTTVISPHTPWPVPAAINHSKAHQVEAPVFSPADGDHYVLSVTITITSATEGALIRYTTDGSKPTSASLSVGPEGKIVWDQVGRTVFSALASKDGYRDSNVTEASYLIIGRAGMPRFSGVTEGGVYISAVNITVTSANTQGAMIQYTTDGSSTPSSASRHVASGGVITWDVPGTSVIRAQAVKGGLAPSQIAEITVTIIGQVSAPRFEPAARDTFVLSATLTVQCDTPGATILYTWDGTTPTPESALTGRGGDTISWPHTGVVTLKAIATREGMADSKMSHKTLHVLEQVAPPHFVTFGQAFERPDDRHATYIRYANFTITSATPGADVYFIAGSGSLKPGSPATVLLPPGENVTVTDLGEMRFRAIAKREGMADSEVTQFYLNIIRELYVEYPMHHVEYAFEIDDTDQSVVVAVEEQEEEDQGPQGNNNKPGGNATTSSGSTTTTTSSSSSSTSPMGTSVNADDDTPPPPPEEEGGSSGLMMDDDTYPGPLPSPDAGDEDEDDEEERVSANAIPGPLPSEDLPPLHKSSSLLPPETDKTTIGAYSTTTNHSSNSNKHTSGANSSTNTSTSSSSSSSNIATNSSTTNSSSSSSTDGMSSWRPVNGSNSSYVQSMPHKRYRKPFSIEGYEGVQPVVSMHVVEAMFKDCSFCTARRVRGRFVTLDNPSKHFSLLQQLPGCGHGAELPSVSGRSYLLPERPVKYVPVGFNRTLLETLNNVTDQQYRDVKDLGCQIVTNAGFFNTTSMECFGNLVSRGQVLRTTTHRSTSFGMRNGSFVIGYLTPEQITDVNNPFQELISGILWLVRDGQSYVEESLKEEYLDYQETGTQFTSVKSARTALGHDRKGRLVILQMEGETWSRGVDLYELADLLVELGVVNAINLDGGGSATLTQNHSLVSDPSWLCDHDNPKSLFRCEKPVATITCIHAAPPPIFVPTETTWANYTNITRAQETAAQEAVVRAAITERSHLCAGFCPSPAPTTSQHQGSSRSSTTTNNNTFSLNGTSITGGMVSAATTKTAWGGGWAGGGDSDSSHVYKISTGVLGGCLLVSLLIHMHTCWSSSAKGSARKRRRRSNSGMPMVMGNGSSNRSSSSHRNGLFQRVSIGEEEDYNDDDDDDDGNEEIDIDHYQPQHVGNGGGHRGAGLTTSLGSLLSLGGRRQQSSVGRRGSGGGGDVQHGVREVEMELNPFLAGAFPSL